VRTPGGKGEKGTLPFVGRGKGGRIEGIDPSLYWGGGRWLEHLCAEERKEKGRREGCFFLLDNEEKKRGFRPRSGDVIVRRDRGKKGKERNSYLSQAPRKGIPEQVSMLSSKEKWPRKEEKGGEHSAALSWREKNGGRQGLLFWSARRRKKERAAMRPKTAKGGEKGRGGREPPHPFHGWDYQKGKGRE